MKLYIIAAVSAALALPRVASAQSVDIPRNMVPPPGMCRIWLDSVPAGQQPAPTDCATAVRNRPEHGRVIFGDDYLAPKSTDSVRKPPLPGITGFAPGKPAIKTKRGRPFLSRP
jgi:hypothetical protein